MQCYIDIACIVAIPQSFFSPRAYLITGKSLENLCGVEWGVGNGMSEPGVQVGGPTFTLWVVLVLPAHMLSSHWHASVRSLLPRMVSWRRWMRDGNPELLQMPVASLASAKMTSWSSTQRCEQP